MIEKNSLDYLKYEELRELALKIISHHEVFYAFWEMVRPKYVISKNCPTACVVFDKNNQCVDFLINKKFWSKQTLDQKAFIICHECLHVLLEHGKRACSNLSIANKEMTNACLDIPINEMLVKYFDFKRKAIDKKNKFCWADTVFESGTATDKSYEFYFNKFQKNPENKKISLCGMGSGEGENGQLESSSHENLNSFNDQSASEKIKELINSLSEEQKESLKDIAQRINKNQEGDNDATSKKQAGNGSGNIIKVIGETIPKPKKKWESVIKKWSQKITKNQKEQPQWGIKSRRNCIISSDLLLPFDIECDIKRNSGDKIDVWMFLDTSGSCLNLAPRFWKAAKSLPREKFNVKYHCFDTKVFELNERDVNQGRLYGFQGTSFIELENFVQKTLSKEKKRYCDIGAIFVITDGWGDYIKPENPKKWYWFLSDDCKTYIPKKSNCFLLQNFE
jgi:hypothetical protein